MLASGLHAVEIVSLPRRHPDRNRPPQLRLYKLRSTSHPAMRDRKQPCTRCTRTVADEQKAVAIGSPRQDSVVSGSVLDVGFSMRLEIDEVDVGVVGVVAGRVTVRDEPPVA